MAHEGYHEPIEKLSVETMDLHRALISLFKTGPITGQH